MGNGSMGKDPSQVIVCVAETKKKEENEQVTSSATSSYTPLSTFFIFYFYFILYHQRIVYKFLNNNEWMNDVCECAMLMWSSNS